MNAELFAELPPTDPTAPGSTAPCSTASGSTASGSTASGSTAQSCVALLHHQGFTLATAESLTAGLIAATVADVPGASTVLRGGLAAYATDVKRDCLRIDEALIERYGVISAECAEAMAFQARLLFGADWAVSATGVAGPAEQEGQPVGTVFIAVAGPDVMRSERLDLSGDRFQIRRATVEAALALVVSTVSPR